LPPIDRSSSRNRDTRIISNTGRIDSAFSRYLLSLDDESFFSLYRNYLGPVKTPYNKHELIGRMVEFLSREDTRRRVRAGIDEQDRLLLAATALLGQPPVETLFRFLEDSFEYGHFRWVLLNHRDRLLLIDGDIVGSVTINPLLAGDILAEDVEPEMLISGEPRPEGTGPEDGQLPWFSCIFLAAFFAFLREFPDFYTRSGAPRKKVSSAMAERFGELFRGDTGTTRLAIALEAMETLHLITREEKTGTIQIRSDAWDELSTVPDRWVQLALWGSALTNSVEQVFEIASVLSTFQRTVPGDRTFSTAEILRLLRLTESGMNLPFDRDSPRRLAATGLLIAEKRNGEDREGTSGKEEEDHQEEDRYRINPAAETLLATSGDSTPAKAVVYASMEVAVAPGIAFRDLLDLARVTCLRRFDIMPVLELTERSVTHARSADREDLIPALHRIAGEEIPQNVRFLLERWQTRAQAIRLVQGLVLVVEQETAELLEASERFPSCYREHLAPGVFLIYPDRREELENLLESLGISALASVEGMPDTPGSVPDFSRMYLRYQQPSLELAPPVFRREKPRATAPPPSGDHHPMDDPPDDPPDDQQENPQEQLQESLQQRSDLPYEVSRELALRIERKLILFPEQLRADVVPTHGIEAHGLDFVGKIRIVEHAIREQELLEIIIRTASGEPQKLLVRPREVVEHADDLMLRALQQPGNKPVRVRIRRASMVRRLSGTLLRDR
jgi:hypothetical protein